MSIEGILGDIVIPSLYKVQQNFERQQVGDIEDELIKEIRCAKVLGGIVPGQSIAIAVGSREIRQLPDIVRVLVKQLRAAGAEPFIVPAMGSDGAGSAEGQKRKLHSFGIDESTVGAPVRSTTESVFIGESHSGIPVFLDRYAYEADGIIVINLVKPNVCFFGDIEGGLLKIIAMGLGKQLGAAVCRNYGTGNISQNIADFGDIALQKANFLFSLGVVENAYKQPAYIKVIHSSNLYQEEYALQQAAIRLMPRLSLPSMDVLIVDEIGSHSSDSGLDAGVVGRGANPAGSQVGSIVALDIGEASQGNGVGIGFADYTTSRVLEKFSFEQTYQQALLSGLSAAAVKIPMVLKNDKLAIQAAIQGSGRRFPGQLRLARIKNTASLGTIYLSPALYTEIRDDSRFVTDGYPSELAFGANGNLF